MLTGKITLVKFIGTKIISYGLFGDVELLGDPVYTSGWQAVFDVPQLIEGNIHKHSIWLRNSLK